MKKLIGGLVAGALALSASTAFAQDALTLQLKWVTQAQFAGYLVAESKGFYDEENLDVTILPGGPNIAPEQVIAGGGADIIVTWMAAGMAARESGVPLVNIAQPFKRSGLMMICPEETGITEVADFPGHTLGVWFFGNEYPFLSWMSQEGISAPIYSAMGALVRGDPLFGLEVLRPFPMRLANAEGSSERPNHRRQSSSKSAMSRKGSHTSRCRRLMSAMTVPSTCIDSYIHSALGDSRMP